MPEINSLVYFGYPVQELAEHCCFEEVAWLLWHGELPNAQQLAAFQADGRSRRHLSQGVAHGDSENPAHRPPDGSAPHRRQFPWDGRPGLGQRGRCRQPGPLDQHDGEDSHHVGLLLPRAQGPGDYSPAQRPGLCAELFHICLGQVPPPEVVRAFEVSLVLYAEHGFNASTFTARVVVSTLRTSIVGSRRPSARSKAPCTAAPTKRLCACCSTSREPARARDWMLARPAREAQDHGLWPPRL